MAIKNLLMLVMALGQLTVPRDLLVIMLMVLDLLMALKDHHTLVMDLVQSVVHKDLLILIILDHLLPMQICLIKVLHLLQNSHH